MTPLVPAILSAIQSAVKSALNVGSPSSVVTVHTKRRFWRDAQGFNSIFKRTDGSANGRVNGWMIYRATTRVEEAAERWRFYAIHKILLEGWMSVADADASWDQAAFDAQIEVIRDNLRLNTNVFNNAEYTTPDTEVEEASTPVTIGDHTCWYARLSLESEAVEVKSA